MGTQEASFEARCVVAMGETLGRLYHSLWQEVAWAWGKWDEYVVLFGTSEERIKLLNDAAPAFFHQLQDSLWEDMLLHLARLTDRPQIGGSANLSVRRLPDAIEEDSTRIAVEGAVRGAMEATAFARDWRNRHIAHRDLALSMSHAAEPLEPASRLQVVEALESLREVINTVSTRYLETTNIFSSGPEVGGATELLWVLRDGLRAGEARRKRLEAGEPQPEDLKSEPLP